MFNKLFKAEGGFTLVELLVTIAILGVLFGIVTLTLGGVGANAEKTVRIAECGVVQSAIDIYMAENNVSTITGRVALNVDEIESGDVDAQFRGYLRDLPTQFTYWWTTAGLLTCP